MPERDALAALMAGYIDQPMSLADACLVRMAELSPNAVVLTLDSHFRVHRIHGRQSIPVIMP
jgi:predicted nucleic acid-binding protein